MKAKAAAANDAATGEAEPKDEGGDMFSAAGVAAE
jgi:hypothetical protein